MENQKINETATSDLQIANLNRKKSLSSNFFVNNCHRRSQNYNDFEGDDEEKASIATKLTNRFGSFKRTLSLQFMSSPKLNKETLAMIRVRYKDIARYVIWPTCRISKQNSAEYLFFNPDHSKRTAIRYNYAGNHQATVLRLNNSNKEMKK